MKDAERVFRIGGRAVAKLVIMSMIFRCKSKRGGRGRGTFEVKIDESRLTGHAASSLLLTRGVTSSVDQRQPVELAGRRST